MSVSDMDYTGWLTKAEAATAIGVTTKSVERMAADGKIQQGATQRQGRGQKIAVYHPDDVARVAAERRQTPAPFVLPAGTALPGNGNGHHTDSNGGEPSTALAIIPPGEDVLRLLFASALRAVSETSQTSEKSDWMTVAAVADAWDWPRADVRALMADGKLGEQFTVGKGRRARVLLRRRAVEAFAAGRKDLEAL